MLYQSVVHCARLLLPSEKTGGQTPGLEPLRACSECGPAGDHRSCRRPAVRTPRGLPRPRGPVPQLSPLPGLPAQGVGGPGAWQPRPLDLCPVPLVSPCRCAFTDGASLPRPVAFPHREEQAPSPPVSPCQLLRCPGRVGVPVPPRLIPGPALPAQQETPPHPGTWGILVFCLFPFIHVGPWLATWPFINRMRKLSRIRRRLLLGARESADAPALT